MPEGGAIRYYDPNLSQPLAPIISIDQFIQHGADVNCADAHGTTFLELLSQSKNRDMWEAVVKYLPNISARDSKGATLFQYAIANGNQPLYDFLLSKV